LKRKILLRVWQGVAERDNRHDDEIDEKVKIADSKNGKDFPGKVVVGSRLNSFFKDKFKNNLF